MADEAYYRWVAAGKPYVRSRPALQFRELLRGHGYVVYDYPNEDHQKADPAQDHTAYSETGWPDWSAEWVGHAIDIMPDGMIPVPLPTLARQIIKDKNAGVPGTKWIKYMNWTDELGVCRQERWMPAHETRSSNDKGHIHISARSDVDISNEVADSDWDPVERTTMSLTGYEHNALLYDNNRLEAIARGFDKVANHAPDAPQAAGEVSWLVVTIKTLVTTLGEVQATVNALTVGTVPPADLQPILDRLAAIEQELGQTPQKTADLVHADLAD